jgi:hypothetical protein
VTPDPNDALLEQLTQAGLYPQQLAQLQRQYQLAQGFMQPQEAQGRQVGGTYVAASPWEHLANAIRPVVGALMQRSAMNREGELTSQLSSGRQAFARALQDSSGHPGEMMPGGAGDQQRQQQLYSLGALSGDPVLENAAKMHMQQQHYDTEMARLQQQIDYQNNSLGLKAREQKPVTDMWGNTKVVSTHAPAQGSALPGAVAASGGGGAAPQAGGGGRGPALPTETDPAKIFPFGKSGPSQAAIDKQAEVLAVTGQMPPGKWGKASAAVSTAVYNRMNELYPDAHLASNKADYVSNSNSLRSLTKAQDSLESFEKGVVQNGKLMLDAAKGIPDFGSSLINQPVRAWKLKAGDPAVARFNTARQVFVTEAGKVLGGALQGSPGTEGMRHEAQELLRGDMTVPQMEAVLQTIEADAANRKGAAASQITDVRGRMSGKPASSQAAPASPAPAAPLSPKDQAAIDWAKKNPGNPDAVEILRLHGLAK